jgi:NAD(P)-dependent dehydrogenase (short-subunit alcohol dehydrogenase family)
MALTFFITGVSSGLGRAFAAAALEAGHTVVGTVRNPDQIAAFEHLAPGRATSWSTTPATASRAPSRRPRSTRSGTSSTSTSSASSP